MESRIGTWIEIGGHQTVRKFVRFYRRHYKVLLPIYLSCSIIGVLLVVLALRQNPSFYWIQFAVDQEERVYIGTLSGVKVYENQDEIGTLSFTTRGYSFTIEDGTELICSSSIGVVHVDLRKDFIHDLEKSIIKTDPLSSSNPNYKLYNKEFVGNGQTYHAKVTPSSCEVFDENGVQLLALGDKRWNIAIIVAAIFWVFPLLFGLPLKLSKNPPSYLASKDD